ncbi:hypothetical protein MTP10_35705 [Nonomuraea sp. 3-1Str]|nr:hypothetical protein [Nonomuraea sp. 3-1Str]
MLRNGKVYSALSARGESPTLNGAVKRILDSVPPGARGRGHGSCGFAICVSKAIEDGEDPTGADAAAVVVRSAADHPKHGEPIGPCNSCEVIANKLRITFFR